MTKLRSSRSAWKILIELTGAPQGVKDPRAAEASQHWKLHLESIWESERARR